MKTLLSLLVALAIAVPCFAKHKEWQDATVVSIGSQRVGTYSTANANAYATGNSVNAYGSGISVGVYTTYYTLRTSTTVYVLAFNPMKNWHRLDLTIHGKTQVYVDGGRLHVRDDSGKDRSLPIVEKVAVQ
jgi:hypothetical protein